MSHRFHKLVEQELYKCSTLSCSYRPPSPIQSFLRTILLRPIRANDTSGLFVDRVDTPDSSFVVPEPNQQNHTTTEEDLSPEHQSELGDAPDTLIFEAVARGVRQLYPMQFQVEPSLDLLSNLRSLSVSTPTAPYGYTHETDNPFQIPAVFNQVLDEYELRSTETYPGGIKFSWRVVYLPYGSPLAPWVLLALLKLPNIREISMHGPSKIYHIRHSADLSVGYSGTSSVTELDFGWGTIDTLSLVRILDMPRTLTKFTYLESLGKPDDFKAAVFGVALRKFRATLQELSLRLRWTSNSYSDSEEEDDGETDSIGSLRDWPVLCNVRCSAAILLGRGPRVATSRLTDILPVVIEDLTIESDDYFTYAEVVDQILEVVEDESYSHLYDVIIVWKDKDDDPKLREACGLLVWV